MTTTMALEKKLGLPTREAYGKTLAELGKENPRIVVLDADLSKSTKTEYFGKLFPERFINCGIGEANMVGKAEYAVIGDLHKILPAVSAEIRRRRG